MAAIDSRLMDLIRRSEKCKTSLTRKIGETKFTLKVDAFAGGDVDAVAELAARVGGKIATKGNLGQADRSFAGTLSGGKADNAVRLMAADTSEEVPEIDEDGDEVVANRLNGVMSKV